MRLKEYGSVLCNKMQKTVQLLVRPFIEKIGKSQEKFGFRLRIQVPVIQRCPPLLPHCREEYKQIRNQKTLKSGGPYGRVQEKRRRRQGSFVGVDLHPFRWNVTVSTEDQEFLSEICPGNSKRLKG